MDAVSFRIPRMRMKWLWNWRVVLPLMLLAVVLVAYLGGIDWWVDHHRRALFASCSRAQRIRNWAELQRLAEGWCRWQPKSADAWLFRADAAQQQGDFAAAADYLAAVPEADPKALPALVALSTLQFGPLNRPLDGVQTCERILKIQPRTAAAHQGLIEFYAMTMQRQKLFRQIHYAIEMSREAPSAYVYLFLVDSMRLANGVELNRTWLKTYPDTELFLVAEALQRPEPVAGTDAPDQDKHARIEALFQRFPHNIELLAYQTELAIRQGDVQKLTRLLKRVPATADGDDRFWRVKGWLHLNRNEIPKARLALNRALKLCPLDWNARSWLADVARREGNLAEADRLQKLVRQARRLREAITAEQSMDNVPYDLLSELLIYARNCGEKQLAEALERRLGSSE